MRGHLHIFLLLIGFSVMAQEAYLPVERFGVKEGLSFRDVKGILKDSEGFMWFATADGLNRYDGVEWKVYKTIEGDSTSIPGNDLRWIYEDDNGDLLIEMVDNRPGYVFYDREEDSFRKIKIVSGLFPSIQILRFPIKLSTGETVSIGNVRDAPPNIVLPGSYLFYYRGNGIFEMGEKVESISATNRVYDYVFPSKRIWMGYSLFEEDRNRFVHFTNSYFGNPTRRFFPIDKKGNFYYPNFDEKVDVLLKKIKLPDHIPTSDWQYKRLDNLGNVWLRNQSNRVYKFDRETGTINEEGEFDMNYFSNRNMFEDSDETLWLTGRYGLRKIKKQKKYFKNYLLDDKRKNIDPSTFLGTAVYSINQGASGDILAMSYYNWIHFFDPKLEGNESGLKRIGYKNGIRQYRYFSSEVVMLPIIDKDIWVLSIFHQKAPLQRWDTTNDEIIDFPFSEVLTVPKDNPPNERISSVQMDEDGKIWYIHHVGQLISFDTLSKKYTVFEGRHFKKGIVGIEKNRMWVASHSVLTKFNEKKEIVKEYEIPNLLPPKGRIDLYKIVPYKDKVWIGTRNGLIEFDTLTEQFKQYTKDDGLSHNIIYTILPVGDHLWMGTHYGLCQFNIKNGFVKNYYEKDGLTHNEFNREAAFQSKDGKLYFGGMNGINAFYPDVLDSLSRLEASRLVWTGFNKIDGQRNSIEHVNTYKFSDKKPIEILHKDRSFTFQFALLNYLNPTENKYYYYLDGFELDWKFSGNTSSVNYPTLPPGTYNFRVKAFDSRGNPGLNELEIPIIVYGPWWETWWARSLFVIFFVGSFFGFYKWRTSSLKRQKLVLESTVKERTAELEEQKERAEKSEQFKEQFLANMSHEIRTPMHAISGMTNILERKEHPKHQDRFLKAMKQSASNLLVILNDILDLSKIEAGKIEIEQIPMNLEEVIHNVKDILKPKAEEKGLNLQSTLSKEVPTEVMGDPTRMNQILINLVGNAIKFTEKGEINISVSTQNDNLRFEIKDTGIGIPEDKLDDVFGSFKQANDSTTRKYGGTGLGLSISKQLIELQDGRIWVESKVGAGSTFFFELPLIPLTSVQTIEEGISEEQLKNMAASLKGIKILLVEDNEFNVMVATDDLTYYIEEVKIGHAENGKEAISEFKNGDYDVILMDIQMPELSGYDASKGIRAIEEQENSTLIPIIAMTASLLKTEIDKCYEAGMDGYIPKPYKIEELIGALYEFRK